MIDNYEIAPAKIADWPDLLYIFDKALRTTDHLSDDDWKALYKNLMSFSYPTYDTYVFKKEGKNVAYISYWREKKLIKMLYVLPEYMNQGIANLLIQHILNTYHETMTIGVKKSNEVAMHLYTKYGFKIHSSEDYDTSGIYYPHYVLIREYAQS